MNGLPLCTVRMPGAHRTQKGILDVLELELETVMGFLVGTGNWTQVFLQEQHVLLTAENRSSPAIILIKIKW